MRPSHLKVFWSWLTSATRGSGLEAALLPAGGGASSTETEPRFHRGRSDFASASRPVSEPSIRNLFPHLATM